jgi:hypothetical protein
MKNEEILHRLKEETNILQMIRWRKANCIGHILLRNCLLKRGIGTGGRSRKQLLDDLEEKYANGNWKRKH